MRQLLSNGPITRLAVATTALAAMLVLAGCSDAMKSTTEAPLLTPAGGTFASSQAVTISDTNPDAVLYCTIDGTAPTTSSPRCAQPTIVYKSETLSAIAVAPGGSASSAVSASFTINLPAAATPVISPTGGTYIAAQTVTIADATAGATIYYTTDGSAPSTSSSIYGGPIVISASETINAVAISSSTTLSAVATAAFVINLPAPIPVISPAAGTYTTIQSVTIGDAAAGATIYYTLDGSTPTVGSAVYNGAITVAKSETVSAVAIAPGSSLSAVAVAAFAINLPPAPTPVISPAGGTFTTVQTVTIADATAGATIYYTIDGTTPTTSSLVYAAPLTVSANESIKAFATAAGDSTSAVASAAFTINLTVATPVISPAGGTFTSIQSVSITDTTPNTTLYYTLDGSTPTTASTIYSGAISVAKSETVSAIGVATGYANSPVASAAFTVNLPPAPLPVFSPVAGTYTTIQNVAITDIATGASIYYTLDGSTPTTSSTPYTTPISVSATETIKAIATATGYSASAVASSLYTIDLAAAATPVISPTGGTFTSSEAVTITDSTPGATIYYTNDGSAPTASSTKYTGPITISSSETIKAIAIANGFNPSAIASAAFTYNQPAAATPVISPAGGTFTSAQTVTIADSTTASTIYYTLDGTVPSNTSTKYTGSITVSASETIKAVATAAGDNTSAVASATFVINLPAAATPVVSPAGGTFTTTQTVTITDTTTGASIFYTLDGTMPTSASTPYTADITVSSTETVKAIATASGYNASGVATAPFTISPTAATPSISPAGGTFSSAQTVTITDATTGATIYYTLDGTTPTTSSTKYSAAITVSATETINAIAAATGDTNSAVATETFTINTITGIPLSGTVSSGTTPIVGASVQLYAAGTSGYASTPTALLTTPVTTSTGAFSLGYTCPAPPGDQLYLVATGGSIGGTANSSIALMTALGSCASLKSGASFTINEITTTASVYALAAFAKPTSGGGIDIGAPAPSATCVSTGKETCNYTGMVNAFKTVNNLANTGTGAALAITPFYAANPVAFLNTSTVPQARIDTIADVLASCVDPGVAGACTALFAAATPAGGSAPVDSLQAALDIAQNPGTNVATLYALIAATPPYLPTLSAAPTDFTIALTFTGAGLGLPYNYSKGSITNTSMDIDATGNILVTGYNVKARDQSEMIAKFSPLGEGLTPVTTQTGSAGATTYGGFFLSTNGLFEPLSLAIDQSSGIWVDNLNQLIKINPDLTFSSIAAPAANQNSQKGNITVDMLGDLWMADGETIKEISNSGTVLSPSGTGWDGVSSADSDGFGDVPHLTFDSTGSTLWASDDNGYSSLYQISTSNGAILYNYFPPSGAPDKSPTPLVADASGNIYGCASGTGISLNKFNATSTSVVETDAIATGRGCGIGPMVMDGAAHIFAKNANSTGTANILDEFTTGGTVISPVSDGYSGTSVNEAVVLNEASDQSAMNIDGSGNIWVLNDNTGTTNVPGNALVEFVGLAAPVLTPQSVALTNGELAVRP